MLDSNTILGIRGHLECKKYDHGILIQNWEDMPLGAPVVYGRGCLESDTTHIMSLISPSQRSAGRDSTNIYSKNVAPVDLKPLCENHKVLTVSQFDIDKFGRLTEFIRDVGSVSLVIEYEDGKKNLAKKLQKLNDVFKYSILFYFNTWGGRHLAGKDDVYACVLTFFDLPYCIPLFNMRKVDGIGLSISGVTVNHSVRDGILQRTFRADFIYSNYEDNLLVIDGVDVNEPRSLTENIFNEIANRANMKLKEGPSLSQKKKRSTENKYGYGYGTGMSELKLEANPELSLKEWPTGEEQVGEVKIVGAGESYGHKHEDTRPSNYSYAAHSSNLPSAPPGDYVEVAQENTAIKKTEQSLAQNQTVPTSIVFNESVNFSAGPIQQHTTTGLDTDDTSEDQDH